MLREPGRKDEVVKYCEDWIQKGHENMIAATTVVYAFIDTKKIDVAEELNLLDGDLSLN